MPTYEFCCPTCEVSVDIQMSMSEFNDTTIKCPRCSDIMNQQFSPPNVSVPHTIGSYADKRTKSADEVESIKQKTEKKSESGWRVEGGQVVHKTQIEGA